MNEKYEELGELELLREIAKTQKKLERRGRITALAAIVLAAVIVVALLVCVPAALRSLDQLNTTLSQTNTAMQEAEKALTQAQGTLSGIDGMVEGVNSIVEDNTELLNGTLTQLSEIDFASLNRSVEQLAAIVQPLARLLGLT